MLCGDNGIKENFSVVDAADMKKTSFGHDWKIFCQTQFFEIGDIIRFKFNLTTLTAKCNVHKLIA
jgi:hypothetical protein